MDALRGSLSGFRQLYPGVETSGLDDYMPDDKLPNRRRNRRLRMRQTLRVRPSNPKDGQFEDIGTTNNVSQDGVYFVTQLDTYYEGMSVFVTLPYNSQDSPENRQYVGHVARVDDLKNSQRGIAVKLLSSPDLS